MMKKFDISYKFDKLLQYFLEIKISQKKVKKLYILMHFLIGLM